MKLRLSLETLRALDRDDLRTVAGGGNKSPGSCNRKRPPKKTGCFPPGTHCRK